ncbi:MAG: endo alpha-1,4 polygalactosaminidase, partial [Pseudomonadota bacterium]
RPYWIDGEWRAPTADEPGFPEFLITVDPDGWEDNYPVSFWDKRWQARLWGSPAALVDLAIADGFDGVYLDWVLGYREPAIVVAAERVGVDPARAMAELIRNLRSYARRKSPGFLVIAQNGGPLAEKVPEFYDWVDAVSQEAVYYYGRANAAWEDQDAADLEVPAEGDWSTKNYERVLAKWQARGKPVFVVDYTAKLKNRLKVQINCLNHGFIGFQTRSPADRLPGTTSPASSP